MNKVAQEFLNKVAQEFFNALNEGNYTQVENILKSTNRYINVVNGHNPLTIAVLKSNYQITKSLLEAGAYINHQTSDGCTALFRSQDLEITKYLIANNADLNFQNSIGETPLINAITTEKNISIISLLITAKANINIKSDDGNTALHHSVLKSSLNIVELLIKNNSNIDIQNNLGETPLITAIKRKDQEIATYIINSNANLDLKTLVDGNTAIIHAFLMQNLTLVDLLINKKADLHILNKIHNYTLLNYAIEKNSTNLIGKLCSLNSSYNIQPLLESYINNNIPGLNLKNFITPDKVKNCINDDNIKKALILAIEHHDNIKIDKIIDLNIDITTSYNNNSILTTAVESCNLNLVQKLVNKNRNLINTSSNKEGSTPLILSFYNIDIFKYLISAGADVNLPDKNGFTPLMNAIMIKKDTIIKILLENKNIDVNIQHSTTKMNALMYSLQYHSKFDITNILSQTTNLEAKDKYGISAIMYSVKYNSIENSRRLLDKQPNKSNINSTDDQGITPLMYASTSNLINLEMLNLLLGYKNCEINKKNITGDTAIVYLVKNHHSDLNMFKLLVDAKADLNLVNSSKESIYHLAVTFSKLDIIKLLVSNHTTVDINIQDNSGRTALLLAINSRYSQPMKELLKHPCIDPLLVDNMYKSAFSYVVHQQEREILEKFMLKYEESKFYTSLLRLFRNINIIDDVSILINGYIVDEDIITFTKIRQKYFKQKLINSMSNDIKLVGLLGDSIGNGINLDIRIEKEQNSFNRVTIMF